MGVLAAAAGTTGISVDQTELPTCRANLSPTSK
jgi:hypothetical protein